jgi:hypothetical protein
MIETTMQAILDDTITSQQLQGHYLYLVRDEEIVLYIGQALNPVERLESHLGLRWRRSKSLFGEVFERNRPGSLTWRVILYQLADCADLLEQYIMPELPSYTLELYYDPARLKGSMTWAEQALIRHYQPCLNDRFNPTPTLLPERYKRAPGASSIYLPTVE